MSTLSLGLRGAEETALADSHRVSVTGLSVTIHSGVIAGMVLIPLLTKPPLPEVTVAPLPLPRFVTVTLPPAGGGSRRAPPAARQTLKAVVPNVMDTATPTEAPVGITQHEGLDLSGSPTGSPDGIGVGDGDGVPGGDCVLGALCGPPVPLPSPEPTLTRVGGAIKEPKLLHQQAPRFPDIARAANVSAIVIIEAHVGEDGRVLETRVLRGHPLFDDEALASVRSRRYAPLLLNGVATEFLTTITVNFQLRR
jgi:TonB family protein